MVMKTHFEKALRFGVVQIGEAYDHDSKGHPLYMTFIDVKDGWEYKGLKEEL